MQAYMYLVNGILCWLLHHLLYSMICWLLHPPGAAMNSDSLPSSIVEVLQKFGPLLSSELSDKLVECGVAKNNNNARQQISRSAMRREIFSTDPGKIGHGHLYYLKEHIPKQYQEAVIKALKKGAVLDNYTKL